MATVLVIDDEPNIRELVRVYLTSAGFDVIEAEDGPEGLRMARDEAPDLVVLDIMLPSMDGADVCRELRARSAVPVVMLTSRDTELDKVALLEAGADDYVTKPFSPPELVARVRAVLRRGPAGPASPEPRRLGGLELDPSTHEVRVDGEEVTLTAKEFSLLETMLAEPGVVFTRERLIERVWGMSEFVDARGVDVHIRHVREKLRDEASHPRFIETVRGVGYRLRKDGG